MPSSIINVLTISTVVYIAILGMLMLHSFGRKTGFKKLIFLNNITSHIIAILALMAVLTKEYSLIDMSLIYALIGPLAGISMLFFKKYFKPSQPSSKKTIVQATTNTYANSISAKAKTVTTKTQATAKSKATKGKKK